jgi:hypothetical protein
MAKPARKFTPPNLRGILEKVQEAKKWSPAETENARVWYERFLELSWSRGGKPVYAMERSSDDVWHEHMLSTKRYRAYCQKQFGAYLDHTPVNPPFSVQEARLKRANLLYKKRFGIQPPDAGTCCL